MLNVRLKKHHHILMLKNIIPPGQSSVAPQVGAFALSLLIPLDILHNNQSEELRILAALSLYKIGDSRGIYAIKQAIKFDESERVSRLCETFYKAYLQDGSIPLVEVASK